MCCCSVGVTSNDKRSRLIQMKQSDDFFLGLDFHLCDEVDEGIHILMGLFQELYIFQAADWRDDDGEVAPLDEDGIHKKAADAAVSVDEGMDEDKFLMDQGGSFHGV